MEMGGRPTDQGLPERFGESMEVVDREVGRRLGRGERRLWRRERPLGLSASEDMGRRKHVRWRPDPSRAKEQGGRTGVRARSEKVRRENNSKVP